jgi:LmbE family N-acetylglucosaminyl deacetylase
MKNNKHVLAIMAHPDDIEFLCAGTLVLLRRKGYTVHLATMTPGDCGSAEHTPEEIARIRVRENARSAAVIGATYDCVGCRDLFVVYDRPTVQRVTELVRKYDPFLVITHSPQCYMLDHEETARLTRAACFGAAVPNWKTEAADPAEPASGVPHLYYADAVEHKNQFGERIVPHFYLDITRAMPAKEKMLKCHASQRNWLRKHHHIDEYIRAMKAMSAERGREVGVKYAECYRQHLGHGYPQDNLLGRIVGQRKI